MTTSRPTRKLLSPPNSVLNLQCPTPLFTPNMFNTTPSPPLASPQTAEKEKKSVSEVFKTHLPPPVTVQPIANISDEEMVEIQKYVKTSGYFDSTKVYDLGVALVRELIR